MNRISTVFGGILVIAIAIVFIVNFQPGGGQNQIQAGPDCAAEVLGGCVRATHFSANMRVIGGGIDTQNAKQFRLKQLVMDGLVERELLLMEAKRLGIGVSQDDVTKELRQGRIRASMPSTASPILSYQLRLGSDGVRDFRQLFLDPKSGKFSVEAYKRTVTEVSRMSEIDFREYQRMEIVAGRMRDVIKARVRVGDSEAHDQFVREKSTATARFIKLTPAFLVDHVVDRSDAAVAAWAEKNAEQIDKTIEAQKKDLGAECRMTRHIMLKPNLDDEDGKKKAREKLEAARKRIADGEEFADVARALSEDVATAKDGGSQGCLVKGTWSKPFDEALFALEKEGSMSDVVETPLGLHLIKLDKILKGDEAKTAARLRIARELYLVGESRRLAAEGAREIQGAVKGGKSMQEALDDYLARVVPKKPEKEKQKEKGADEDKGEGKDKPKDTDEGKGKPKDQPKDKDADKGAEDAGEKKDADKDEDAALDEEAEMNLPSVETGLPFTATGQPFEGAAPGENPAGAVLALVKPNDVSDKIIPLDNGGYAVVQLVEKKIPTDEEWKEAREFYMTSLRAKKQAGAFADYMKRLRSAHAAEIKPNQSFVTDPEDAKGEGAPPEP